MPVELVQRNRGRRVRAEVSHPVERLAGGLFGFSRLLLLVVVAIAPWLFGGVPLWVESALFLAVLVALLSWILGTTILSQQRNWNGLALPTTLVPLCLALLLGALQLAPFGPAIVACFTPDDFPVNAHVSADSETAAWFPARKTLSFSPPATRLSLAQLSLATLALCLAAALFRRRQHQIWIWGLLLVNGAALSVFGIVQRLTWNDHLYWILPLNRGGQPFASFVNRNNAAGYLNLCLAGGLGVLIWSMYRSRRTSRANAMAAAARESDRLSGLTLLALLGLGVVVAGVFASLSRGGVVALLAGGAVTAVVVARAGRTVGPICLAVAAVVLGLVLLRSSALEPIVQQRLASLMDQDVAGDGRLLHWRDAWGAASDFWLTGTGLGTYHWAYQPYQARLDELLYFHAENQYLEALVEGGILGVLLLATAIWTVCAALNALLRFAVRLTTDAAACVGLFAIASQAVHALFDFGLFLPANMLTMAVICGAVVGRAIRVCGDFPTAQRFGLPPLQNRAALIGVLLFLLINGIAGLAEVALAAPGEQALAEVRAAKSPGRRPELMEVENGLQIVTEAVRRRPDDPDLHLALAELWIARYRLQMRDQLRREAVRTGKNPTDREVWNATHPHVLHQRVNVLARAENVSAIDELRSHHIVRENLLPALEHLFSARVACAILPRVDLHMAALAFLADAQQTSGEPWLQHAIQVTPSDPDTLFEAGRLAQQAGLNALAYSCWQRSLELSFRHRASILKRVSSVPFETLLREVLPQSPTVLLDLADSFEGDRRTRIVEHARNLLAQRDEYPEADRHYVLAKSLWVEGRTEAALIEYRQALQLNPSADTWRYEFAAALYELGRLDEARVEAAQCLSLASKRPEVQALLAKLAQPEKGSSRSGNLPVPASGKP